MPKQTSAKEYCNNPKCKTPKCPYRKKSETAEDLSLDCGYYSETGDGRYQKMREKFLTKQSYEDYLRNRKY